MRGRSSNQTLICLAAVLAAWLFGIGCPAAVADPQKIYFGGFEDDGSGNFGPLAGSFTYETNQPASSFSATPVGTFANYSASSLVFATPSGPPVPFAPDPGSMTIGPYGDVESGLQVQVGGTSSGGQFGGVSLQLAGLNTSLSGVATAIPAASPIGANSSVVGFALLGTPDPNAGLDNQSEYDITAASTSFAKTFVYNSGTDNATTVGSTQNRTYTFGAVTINVGGPLSTSGQPTQIAASFTPEFGLSLAAAAALGGFVNFDWEQTVTQQPAPSPFFSKLDPTTPLTAPPGYNDPPPGAYTYDTSPCADSFPFYYSATAAQSCGLSTLAHETQTTLSFRDSPTDSCLPGGLGIGCDGLTANSGYVAFTTELVGILPSGFGEDLFQWDWISTFNGTSGGLSKLANDDLIDVGSGSGGANVLDIEGVSTVSEPPSLLLLCLGICAIILVARRHSGRLRA